MANHKAAMSISLTKDLKEYVKQRTKTAHFGTPSDYMRSLIRDDMRHAEHERLEQELLKGLRSKSRVITPKEWERLKADILQRAER